MELRRAHITFASQLVKQPYFRNSVVIEIGDAQRISEETCFDIDRTVLDEIHKCPYPFCSGIGIQEVVAPKESIAIPLFIGWLFPRFVE